MAERRRDPDAVIVAEAEKEPSHWDELAQEQISGPVLPQSAASEIAGAAEPGPSPPYAEADGPG